MNGSVIVDADVFMYTLMDREFVERNFKMFVRPVLVHMKNRQIHPKYLKKMRMYADYCIEFCICVSQILTKIKHIHIPIHERTFTVTSFNNMTPAELLNRLKLEPYELERRDYHIMYWGPQYWYFLHTATCLVQTDVKLTDRFACLLINFDLIIGCGVCAIHYEEKNPLETLTMPIHKTQDPITQMFCFHNTVNVALGKAVYSEEEFLAYYRLKKIFVRKEHSLQQY